MVYQNQGKIDVILFQLFNSGKCIRFPIYTGLGFPYAKALRSKEPPSLTRCRKPLVTTSVRLRYRLIVIPRSW